MKILSPEVAAQVLTDSEKSCLIDIREPYERLSCSIECLAIPMAEFATSYPTLKNYDKIILMCQSGKRAEALANFIETEYTAENIYILEGGLNAWIQRNSPEITCQ